MSDALPTSTHCFATSPSLIPNADTPSKTPRKRKHDADISERMANEREMKRRMDAKAKEDRKAIYRRMFSGSVRDVYKGKDGKSYWRILTILPDGSSRTRNGLEADDTTVFSTSLTPSQAARGEDNADELFWM